ncbi:MAG: hypothetical protein JWN04_6897, partial [Myxococcaceae bacterium]|nr:hypothetical protein [Myxococcaceae bacterium]
MAQLRSSKWLSLGALGALLACTDASKPEVRGQTTAPVMHGDAGLPRDAGGRKDAGQVADQPSESEAPADEPPAIVLDDAGSPVALPLGVTYQREIRPLLEDNCVECHTQGGIGPSRLDDWTTVKALGGAIVAAVGAGRMPPWPASDTCHPIQDSRALPQATKDLFAQWQTDGFQQGDEADYVPPPKRHRLELGPPSVTMQGDAPFTPSSDADTYRCFFVGTVDVDTYVTALDIVPSVRAEVHHVQLHRVNAADVASVRSQDESDTGGGYGCNAAGVGGFVSSQNLFSYRPGALAVVLEQGDAAYLKKGSGLVLQVHYNTQFLPP